MYKEIDSDNFQQIVDNNHTVFVQYAAGWCGNCRVMKPKFKRFANDHDQVPFIVVDAEKYPESRKLANVDNLPTFAAFRNGKLVKQVQTNKADSLKQLIDETTMINDSQS